MASPFASTPYAVRRATYFDGLYYGMTCEEFAAQHGNHLPANLAAAQPSG